MEGVIGLAILQGESLVTEIRGLDAKGSGQAVVWRENELGNKVIPREFVTYPQGKGYYEIPVKENPNCNK